MCAKHPEQARGFGADRRELARSLLMLATQFN